jgi:hypothetical protein
MNAFDFCLVGILSGLDSAAPAIAKLTIAVGPCAGAPERIGVCQRFSPYPSRSTSIDEPRFSRSKYDATLEASLAAIFRQGSSSASKASSLAGFLLLPCPSMLSVVPRPVPLPDRVLLTTEHTEGHRKNHLQNRAPAALPSVACRRCRVQSMFAEHNGSG